MKTSHASNASLERSVKLRRVIFELIRDSDHAMTCAELARILKENVRSVRNYCSLLKEGHWLSFGPTVTLNDRSRRKTITWVLGTNPSPIPNPVKYRKPPPKKERPVDAMITSDDLAWMRKYQEQREQRYLKRGLEVPSIY